MFILCYYAAIMLPLNVYYAAINLPCYYDVVMLLFKAYYASIMLLFILKVYYAAIMRLLLFAGTLRIVGYTHHMLYTILCYSI